MGKISNIVILNTPFHKIAVEELFLDFLKAPNTIVIYGKNIQLEKKEFPITYEVKDYQFSRKDTFKKPLKTFCSNRRKIAKIKSEIVKLDDLIDIKNELRIIICSDKDIFTQILLNHLFKRDQNIRLIAVDEGLGFYVSIRPIDHFLSRIYSFLTPILFGEKLFYVKRMGVYPHIKEIYLRAPDLIKNKRKDVLYKSFKLNVTKTKLNTSQKKSGVLMYSFPEQDFSMNEEIKIHLLFSIANELTAKNKHFYIKPHPRENIEPLCRVFNEVQTVTILDKKEIGENLDYFDYELIIHFFSSVILNLLDRGYPKNKILTLGYYKRPPIHFDKELKYIFYKDFNSQKHLNI